MSTGHLQISELSEARLYPRKKFQLNLSTYYARFVHESTEFLLLVEIVLTVHSFQMRWQAHAPLVRIDAPMSPLKKYNLRCEGQIYSLRPGHALVLLLLLLSVILSRIQPLS